MTRWLALCLTPIALVAMLSRPATPAPDVGDGGSASTARGDSGLLSGAPARSVASSHRPPPAGLRRAIAEALIEAVPGASANGLQVIALQHAPIGIGDWHRVSGHARIGTGDSAAALRFTARYDGTSATVAALAMGGATPPARVLSDAARHAIEAAVRAALRAEFPEQAPGVALLTLSRHPAADPRAAVGGELRVFRGQGRIDFGDEGEVIAPIEVVLDADARVVALRYSLDELDPAPFDGARSGPGAGEDDFSDFLAAR
jgi:hypothetical protein